MDKKTEYHQLTLWDLMTYLAGGMAFGASISASKSLAGIWSYAFFFGLSFGLLVSILCVFIIHLIGERIRMHYLDKSESVIKLLYFIKFSSILFSGILGSLATEQFVRWLIRL